MEDFAEKMKKLRSQFPMYDAMTENLIEEVELVSWMVKEDQIRPRLLLDDFHYGVQQQYQEFY